MFSVSDALDMALAGLSDYIGEEPALTLREQLNKLGRCDDPSELFNGVAGAFVGCINVIGIGNHHKVAHALARRTRGIVAALATTDSVRDQVIERAKKSQMVIDE